MQTVVQVDIQSIEDAAKRLKGVAQRTPLQFSKRLSEQYNAKIFFKREDLQEVRSFKIRGAYNKIASLSEEEATRGVVCASAGNHAQGVAYGCSARKIKGTIFMPTTTPNQKIQKVKKFGGEYVEVRLVGNTFDDASAAAQDYCKQQGSVFVHPFNDPYTIAGQGTIALEIWQQMEKCESADKEKPIDYVICAIGGGGLISGVGTYFKQRNPAIKVIGVEPTGAASMYKSIHDHKIETLSTVDTFCDGVAVKTPGTLTFEIVKKDVDDIVIIEEGHVATDMIEMYQNEGIVTEPSGALAVSALEKMKDQIVGKTVVCVICGGNNDILRYPEIMERSLIYKGLKHYFILEFAQKPGQLKNFLNNALGQNDDIVRFEYMKKTNKEKGPALVGIELKHKDDLDVLLEKMKVMDIQYRKITPDDLIYDLII